MKRRTSLEERQVRSARRALRAERLVTSDKAERHTLRLQLLTLAIIAKKLRALRLKTTT